MNKAQLIKHINRIFQTKKETQQIDPYIASLKIACINIVSSFDLDQNPQTLILLAEFIWKMQEAKLALDTITTQSTIKKIPKSPCQNPIQMMTQTKKYSGEKMIDTINAFKGFRPKII